MVSFGNYDAEGVNRMQYPAQTTDGETVTIVDKKTGDPSRPTTSQILISDDGRTFAPAKQGGLIEEITAIIEDAAEEVVEEVKETLSEVVDAVKDKLDGDDNSEPEEPAAA